jgi:hypothetical protein
MGRLKEASMINGAHVIVYSKDVEADRAFFRDVLKFGHVDAGNGRLMFALPKAETAMHESDENDVHEMYLMTDDLEAEIAAIRKAGIDCDPPADRGWGIVTRIKLPGGGTLGLYQPRHARP